MPNPLLALEERYLTPILPALQGKSVLDLACGTGRWLRVLLDMAPRVAAGVDLTSAMLEIAERKPGLRGALAQADSARLPFPARCFDLVLFSFALGHVTEMATTALELARVMKPVADLYITDLHPEAYKNGWRAGFRDERGAVELEHHPRSLPSIAACFQSAGFSLWQLLSCFLGEPELPLLDRAGKGAELEALQGVPAIYLGHFKRNPGFGAEAQG